MDVTEIGRRSPGPVTIEVLGTGVIVAVLQVRGTFCRAKERFSQYYSELPPCNNTIMTKQSVN